MSTTPKTLGEERLAILGAFLRGEIDAPPDSWVYRENWLTFHFGAFPQELHQMLDKEIEKVVSSAAAEPWAWESLCRLYNSCRERGEPLPARLQSWVDDVVNGAVQRPNPRGPKPDTAEHSRYRIAFHVLTEFLKFKRRGALLEMSTATGESEDTIKSRLRRAGIGISA